MPALVLLRHGESTWNAEDRFAGWVNVGLTPAGEEEARRAGVLLRTAGLVPSVLHTSALTRAIRTGDIALAAAGRPDAPAHRHWRLNERCYGALQGRHRADVRAEYGDALYRRWRRGYDLAPPPVPPGSEWDTTTDPRYADLPRHLVPATESLADVVARLLPCWHGVLAPDLHAGRTVLVTAHGNSLRALVTHLDRLTPDEVLELDIPTGAPLHYDLDAHLAPRTRGGRYLTEV